MQLPELELALGVYLPSKRKLNQMFGENGSVLANISQDSLSISSKLLYPGMRKNPKKLGIKGINPKTLVISAFHSTKER